MAIAPTGVTVSRSKGRRGSHIASTLRVSILVQRASKAASKSIPLSPGLSGERGDQYRAALLKEHRFSAKIAQTLSVIGIHGLRLHYVLEGLGIGEPFAPYRFELAQQPAGADGSFVPVANESYYVVRLGSQMLGGDEATLPQVGALAQHTEPAHLGPRWQTMGDGAQQRTRQPGMASGATGPQIVQKGQQIEILKVAKYSLNAGRDGHGNSPRA